MPASRQKRRFRDTQPGCPSPSPSLRRSSRAEKQKPGPSCLPLAPP